jgi:hypothetical protein
MRTHRVTNTLFIWEVVGTSVSYNYLSFSHYWCLSANNIFQRPNFQSSVRNGIAGNPSLLNKLGTGVSRKAKRTATG